jgi:Holliday junction resolvase RusA-like endonuclease
MGVGRARSRIVTAKGGRQFVSNYTPAATRNEAGVIRQYAEDAMAGRAPFTGAVELKMAMYFPIPSSFSKAKRAAALSGTIRPTVKPDWDNGAKFTDALSKVVWADDKQVTDAFVWKRYSTHPRVVMEIREI